MAKWNSFISSWLSLRDAKKVAASLKALEAPNVRTEISGFVLGQPSDLHTLTSDIYRLQTAAQPRAQWQQELTAVISYPLVIRRLFLAAYVSAGVRARRLNHTRRWQSASKVLVIFYSSCFDFNMHAGESGADWRVSQQRDVCALIVTSSRALTSARDRLPPRQAAWARAHWPEINKRARVSGEVTMATSELILSCLS